MVLTVCNDTTERHAMTPRTIELYRIVGMSLRADSRQSGLSLALVHAVTFCGTPNLKAMNRLTLMIYLFLPNEFE